MNKRYEHKGKNLDRPIIRCILGKCLVDRGVHRAINPQQNSLSVHEFGENICQYHQQNGGAPMQLLDSYTPFYGRLRELEKQGSAVRHRASGRDYWKLIPSYKDET